jgi:CspA family cold shock protein
MAVGINGIMKWFNTYKGYGFIQVENEEDVFVHYHIICRDGIVL